MVCESQATSQAAELRSQASQHHQDAIDSFDRCDTDGFLSQWASGLTGRLKSTQADILDAGGVSEFWGLFDAATGERVKAKQIKGKFGLCWLLLDASDNTAGFLPWCEAATDLEISFQNRYSDDAGELLELDSPEHNARHAANASKIQKRIAKWEAKHGYSQRREMAPAAAKIDGSGYGLSGSAWVSVYRTDRGYPANAKPFGTKGTASQ